MTRMYSKQWIIRKIYVMCVNKKPVNNSVQSKIL